MPRNTTPFDSLPDAALFVTLFLTCWKVAAWVIGLTATYLLLCRLGRWVQAKPVARRFLAALVLLWCKPRPIDGSLFTFCYPNND